MAYHPLANDTGGTADDRVVEARRIVKMLDGAGVIDEMSPKEQEFAEQMRFCDFASPKQVFWLRDILENYLG